MLNTCSTATNMTSCYVSDITWVNGMSSDGICPKRIMVLRKRRIQHLNLGIKKWGLSISVTFN